MSSTDIQSLVINATDFTPSKDVGYNKPRVNKAGGKAVSIVNNTTRRQLMITTPLMLTWGVNERRDESSGRVSYDMSLQFPKEAYATPETTAFLQAMEAMEAQVMSDAIKNSKEWFNKARLTDGQVDVLFNRMLYWPKDKETGERRADSAPTLRVKIDYWDEAFNCEIYNVDQSPLFPSKSDASLMPNDFITKGSNVACVLKCGGVYFVNGKFGVTWRLVQAVVKPRASIAGRCVIQLSSADKEKLQNQQELDDDEDEDGVVVQEDSDEEDEDDESVVSASSGPTFSKKVAKQEVEEEVKPKKKTVKKRVVRRKKTSSSDE